MRANLQQKKLFWILCFAVLWSTAVFSSVDAFAQTKCWTTVASTGTVDEADTGMVLFSGPDASIRSTQTSGTLDLRYDIVAVDGIFGGDNIGMTVRYRDNGANARVLVRIKQLNLSTGAITTKLTFDSNLFDQSSALQTRTVTSTCFTGSFFDFGLNAYYIEVQIIKNNATGTPLLEGIQVCYSLC